jgi:hypothetical protein
MERQMGRWPGKFKYSEAVDVVLGPSRQAAAGLLAASAATVGIVACTPWGLTLQAALGAAVLAGAMRAHRCVARLRGHAAISRFRLEPDGTLTGSGSGEGQLEGRIRPGSFVAPWLTIVRWRPEGARFDRTIPVFPDMLDADAFRRLRVLLRWSGEPPSPWSRR